MHMDVNIHRRSSYLSDLFHDIIPDHDKMENTCTCLNIITISELNFWSLFYHDSIIKIFCSREQCISHVHAHTFTHAHFSLVHKIMLHVQHDYFSALDQSNS